MSHGGDVYGRGSALDFSISVNARPTPRKLRDALLGAVDCVGAYPDLLQRDFREVAARVCRVRPERIWGVAGASEAFVAVANRLRPKRALLVRPCFSGYRRALEASGDCEIVEYPTREENGFALDDEILNWIDDSIDAFFFANPNNPTGRAIAPELTDRVLKKCAAVGAAAIVDESFLRMTDVARSVRARVDEFENLVVVDSLTKLFAIPGARVGCVVARERRLDAIRAALPEWNMSAFALAAGVACFELIEEETFVSESLREITRERAFLTDALRELGLRVYESDANFILFRGAGTLGRRLLERDVLIRDCRDFGGLTEGFYRIAARRRQENEKLVATMAEVVGKPSGDGR